jgi:hypothetical protein
MAPDKRIHTQQQVILRVVLYATQQKRPPNLVQRLDNLLFFLHPWLIFMQKAVQIHAIRIYEIQQREQLLQAVLQRVPVINSRPQEMKACTI